MKTTNNLQKTENNKFENPVSKIFAVVLSLVLISLTVSANGFWKQILVNNTYGKMAILMVDQEKSNNELVTFVSANPVTTLIENSNESKYFVVETANEKKLSIESWMTNDTFFSTNTFAEESSNDKPLMIEDWMTNDQVFSAPVFKTDIEPDLVIEDWMKNENIW